MAREAVIQETDDEDAVEFYPDAKVKEDGSVVDKKTGELLEAPTVEKVEPRFPLKGEGGGGKSEESTDGRGTSVEKEAEASEKEEAESPAEEVGEEVDLI